MSLNSFSSNKKFYDDKNFPYGFQRSGYFTFMEADALSNFGHIMNQLAENKMSPEGEEHEHFLQVLEGTTEPANLAEKTYLKYRKIIHHNNTFISTVVKVNDKNASNYDDIDEEDQA